MKTLIEKRKSLIIHFNCLLREYKEYQEYFIGVSKPEEAEDKFYAERFNESGHDVYYEGVFSFEHKSLFWRIEENKKQRNLITSEIKNLKKQIKELSNIKK